MLVWLPTRRTKIIFSSLLNLLFFTEINHFSLSFITLKFIIVLLNNLFRFFFCWENSISSKLIFSRADEMKNYQMFPAPCFTASSVFFITIAWKSEESNVRGRWECKSNVCWFKKIPNKSWKCAEANDNFHNSSSPSTTASTSTAKLEA